MCIPDASINGNYIFSTMLTGGCDDLPSQTQSVKGMVNLAALEWLYYKVITTPL